MCGPRKDTEAIRESSKPLCQQLMPTGTRLRKNNKAGFRMPTNGSFLFLALIHWIRFTTPRTCYPHPLSFFTSPRLTSRI